MPSFVVLGFSTSLLHKNFEVTKDWLFQRQKQKITAWETGVDLMQKQQTFTKPPTTASLTKYILAAPIQTKQGQFIGNIHNACP